MQKGRELAMGLIEHLLAWLAFFGFIFWSSLWAFVYAFQGGFGGTPSFHPLFVLFILIGYVAYGLVMLSIYRFFGRVRFLPWQAPKAPFRDLFILLIFSASAVIYYLVFFIHGKSVWPNIFG